MLSFMHIHTRKYFALLVLCLPISCCAKAFLHFTSICILPTNKLHGCFSNNFLLSTKQSQFLLQLQLNRAKGVILLLIASVLFPSWATCSSSPLLMSSPNDRISERVKDVLLSCFHSSSIES